MTSETERVERICSLCSTTDAEIQLTNNVMINNLETGAQFGPTQSLIYYCENCFSKILQRWDLRDE